MKRILKYLFIMLCFLTIVPASVFADNGYVSMNLGDTLKDENISADLSNYSESTDKINVYLFRGKGCGHCEEFLGYVADTLVPEYGKYFNFISYETWYNSNNVKLMTSVSNALNANASGVPFIVVGDKFFLGYSSSMNEQIEKAIVDEYNKEEHTDKVSEVLSGTVSTPASSISSSEKTTGIIVTCVLAVVVLGVFGFIIYKNSKKK